MQENKNANAPVNGATEEEQLIEQARIRREKLAKLVSEGKNPYEQVKYPVDADSESIKNNYEAYEGKTVAMAGRMMSRRIMGKASFSHIADKSGKTIKSATDIKTGDYVEITLKDGVAEAVVASIQRGDIYGEKAGS